MAFRRHSQHHDVPNSPELLHRNLPRGPGAVASLWTHQSDIIREYMANHQNSADVALELPTGTGKTLPGLLIAEWVRLKRGCHVIYACPTRQLARQVFETAQREGLSAALLIGNHREWPVEHASFVATECIAMTTYSSIFNVSPKLEIPELIVFDDAHSGEQYVAGAYSVNILRSEDEETYLKILSVLAPALDGLFVERLRSDIRDIAAHEHVRIALPVQEIWLLQNLEQTLARELDGNSAFQFSMIRSGLASCIICISESSILIRPLIPPTHENRILREAKQRIYLSATLGHGGELERAFGRKHIDRIPLPDSSPTPRSGRRFFVFADLVKGTSSRDITKRIVGAVGKALVLTPDYKSASDLSEIFADGVLTGV